MKETFPSTMTAAAIAKKDREAPFFQYPRFLLTFDVCINICFVVEVTARVGFPMNTPWDVDVLAAVGNVVLGSAGCVARVVTETPRDVDILGTSDIVDLEVSETMVCASPTDIPILTILAMLGTPVLLMAKSM
jgi:hypothetical protein